MRLSRNENLEPGTDNYWGLYPGQFEAASSSSLWEKQKIKKKSINTFMWLSANQKWMITSFRSDCWDLHGYGLSSVRSSPSVTKWGSRISRTLFDLELTILHRPNTDLLDSHVEYDVTNYLQSAVIAKKTWKMLVSSIISQERFKRDHKILLTYRDNRSHKAAVYGITSCLRSAAKCNTA